MSAHLLEDAAQGDVVHTPMVTTDDDGYEKVVKRHGEPNLLFFRAARAGLTQRAKKACTRPSYQRPERVRRPRRPERRR